MSQETSPPTFDLKIALSFPALVRDVVVRPLHVVARFSRPLVIRGHRAHGISFSTRIMGCYYSVNATSQLYVHSLAAFQFH